MHVRKESGGTTVTHRHVQYEWPDDGSVLEVPDEFGAILLAIRGGGYSEVPKPEPEPEPEFSEVVTAEGDATDKPKRGAGRKAAAE